MDDSSFSGSEIAIIGIGGRFPGALNIEQYWKNLCMGKESITFFSDKDLIERGVPLNEINKPNYVKAASFIDGEDLFDASFFGIPPREAELIDPQHRLLLECAWEVMETAGYSMVHYDGSIGVYVGSSMNPGWVVSLFTEHNIEMDAFGGWRSSLYSRDYLASRISYKMNLKGPSINIQSACSTSLVAVHLASQAIINGECDMAVAGGASVGNNSHKGYVYHPGSIKSPDGHCRAFDKKAKGTIFGNGYGLVVLKRFEEAVKHHDNIIAVIRGTAVNNDGSSKPGFTSPSVDAQMRVIGEALSVANVSADTISYVEAHGTGTSLGDPIEVEALKKAFETHTNKKGFCAIGSVKSNIGHLSAASGIASLIKVCLMLKNKVIPPSINYDEPNPQIDFKNSPFYVNTNLREWVRKDTPLRGGISSFGLGGTNAHVVLEEAPIRESLRQKTEKYYLLPISAKSKTALNNLRKNLINYLDNNPRIDIADVAYTLQIGRKSFDYRQILLCKNNYEEAFKSVWEGNIDRHEKNVIFMFPGQGTQYINMGKKLYENEHVFRSSLDECRSLLLNQLEVDIQEILYKSDFGNINDINQTVYTQPILFSIEYALAKQFMYWGVIPNAMIGHSLGEFVAACISGVISLEDALLIVGKRGQLMQSLPEGKMISVHLSEEEVSEYVEPGVSIAAVNGPQLCVLSGEKSKISNIIETLTKKRIPFRQLNTLHAFHSEMMFPVLPEFLEFVRNIKINPPSIPYISNLTGDWVNFEDVKNPNYWLQHLISPVQFFKGINKLLMDQDNVFLELGPGKTLCTLVGATANPQEDRIIIPTMDSKIGINDNLSITNAVGKLWLYSTSFDWIKYNENEEDLYRIPLPTYPFERQSYWPGISNNSINKEMEEFEIEKHEKKYYSRPNLSTVFETPTTELERRILGIWRDLFAIDEIGVNDNFFELGGDSILAIRFVSAARQLNIDLSISQIFDNPTIKKIADEISDYPLNSENYSDTNVKPAFMERYSKQQLEHIEELIKKANED